MNIEHDGWSHTEADIPHCAVCTANVLLPSPVEEHHELRIHNMQLDRANELLIVSLPYCPCGWVSESGPESAQEITDAYREHLS